MNNKKTSELSEFRFLKKYSDDGIPLFAQDILPDSQWGFCNTIIKTAREKYGLKLYDKHSDPSSTTKIVSPIEGSKGFNADRGLIEICPYGKAFGFSFADPEHELTRHALQSIQEYYDGIEEKKKKFRNTNDDFGVQEWKTKQGYRLIGWVGKFKNTQTLLCLYIHFLKKAIQELDTGSFGKRVKDNNPDFLK